MGPREFLTALAMALGLPADTPFCFQLFSNESSALGADEQGQEVTGHNQTFLATAETIGTEIGRRVDAKFPNVYLTSGLFPPEKITETSGRTQENCTRALWLTIDADAKDWLAHEQGRSVKEVVAEVQSLDHEALHELLVRHANVVLETAEKVGLLPSIWVRSGYGHYGLYLLANGEDIDEARRLSAAMRDAWCAAAGWKIADSTIDAGTRIVRLPGTFNVKNPERPRRCRTGKSSWQVYTLESLAERFPVRAEPEKPARREKATASPPPRAVAEEEKLARLSRNALLYLHGTLPAVGQRNPTLFNVACEFESAGFTRDEAEGLLRPLAEQNGLESQEIRATIGSAYRKERQPAKSVAVKTDGGLTDVNLEFRLLASAMASPDACGQVCSRCDAWLFSSNEARQIFFSVRSLHYQRIRVDPMVVYSDLHSRNHLAAAEAARELDGSEGLATDAIAEIISVLREHATSRRMRSIALEALDMLAQPHEHRDLDWVFKAMQDLQTFRTPTHWTPLVEAFKEVYAVAEQTVAVVKRMEEAGDEDRAAAVGALPLPIPELNDILAGGLELGVLSIVAAGPGRGKTALAMDTALNLARRHQVQCGYLTLELSQLQVAQRIMCSQIPLLAGELRRADLNDGEWDKMATLMNEASGIPLHFFQMATTFHEVRSAVSVGALEHGMKFFVIDFVQLINLPNSKRGEVGDLNYVMRSLHGMAQQLGVHIMILSQLKKGGNLKRPALSDLLGSGSLEQMIRTGISVWNDKDQKSTIREALICVMKGDEGTGEVECRYHTTRQRFVR